MTRAELVQLLGAEKGLLVDRILCRDGWPFVRLSKTFDFDAAHWLPHVPDGHKCRRMHGHTYRVEVVCSGDADERGMLIDFADIAAAWAPVRALLDHQVLNELPFFENPTAECVAAAICDKLGRSIPCLELVRLYESATTWCEVRRS